MKPFRDIVFTLPGYALRIVLLLLVFTQACVCVAAFARRRGGVYRAAAVGHLLVLLGLFLLMADGVYLPQHLPPRESFPAAVTFVYALPWLPYAVLEVLSAAAAALCLLGERRIARRRPSFDSVKEAMDDLPVGVCFIARNGTVALCNLRMNEWCQRITGQPLSDGQAFLRAVEAAGEARSGQMLLQPDDDCVLLFAETQILVDGRPYRQLTATDMTQQFRVTAELETRNAKLRDISVRMKAYSVELTDMVMRRESFSARVAVHDGLGHALLRAKRYFEQPDAAGARALYDLLRETNGYLLGAAQAGAEQEQDPFEGALQVAKGVGVRVTVTGSPPQAQPLRRLAGQALRECAVNAVKHAGADCLTVAFAETPDADTVTISNNGMPAEAGIVFTGGLRSLDEAVAAAGGELRVTPQPVFTVAFRLPK